MYSLQSKLKIGFQISLRNFGKFRMRRDLQMGFDNLPFKVLCLLSRFHLCRGRCLLVHFTENHKPASGFSDVSYCYNIYSPGHTIVKSIFMHESAMLVINRSYLRKSTKISLKECKFLKFAIKPS